MFGLLGYVSLGLGAALALSGGVIWYQSSSIDELRAELRLESVELKACGARLANLVEDIRSDAEIDSLPDSALVDVPPHWLLGPLDSD